MGRFIVGYKVSNVDMVERALKKWHMSGWRWHSCDGMVPKFIKEKLQRSEQIIIVVAKKTPTFHWTSDMDYLPSSLEIKTSNDKLYREV